MPFNFEKLIVWQRAIQLSVEVNRIAKSFPNDEVYVLSSQMRRASDSIALNIAEGSTGQTKPEFKRFLSIALRSDIEVVSCIHLAKSRNIISDDDFSIVYKRCEEISIMLNALKKSLGT
jgi:four helix bundle protein